MTTWVTDDNRNRASVEYWGSREAAEASLKTLVNCTDCTNCVGCTNCRGCMGCGDCMDCTNCRYCTDCTDCRNCTDCWDCWDCWDCRNCTDCTDCTNCHSIKQTRLPLYVGPFRSDGYQFVVSDDGGIRAGCRVFGSFKEARKHWKETRSGTPLGNETMKILDFMESMVN